MRTITGKGLLTVTASNRQEDDADPTEDDARYAHIEGIRVPIVVTGQPWTEAEIEAFIEITARVGGSPYRAAGLFDEHTSRTRAATMGMYRRLLAEGRMERSERSRHRSRSLFPQPEE